MAAGHAEWRSVHPSGWSVGRSGLAPEGKLGNLEALPENSAVVIKPVKRRARTTGNLAALSDLLQDSRTDAARLFEHGLHLLVQALGVDRALLTRVTELGYEVFWWAVSPRAKMN